MSVLKFHEDKYNFPWDFCEDEDFKARCCEICNTLDEYLYYKPPLFPPPPHPPTDPYPPQIPPNNPPSMTDTALFTIDSVSQEQVTSQILNVSALNNLDPFLRAEYIYTFENLMLSEESDLIRNITACQIYECRLSELEPARIHIRVDPMQSHFPVLDARMVDKFNITEELMVVYSKYYHSENYVISIINNYLASINANYSKIETFSISSDTVVVPSSPYSPPDISTSFPSSPSIMANDSTTYTDSDNLIAFVIILVTVSAGSLCIGCSYILYFPRM